MLWPSFKYLPQINFKFYTDLSKNPKNQSNIILINYKHVSSQFPRYSYSDVLENKVPPDAFKDKAVLIGVTSSGKSEYYVTPFSRNQPALLSGTSSVLTIQAQIIDSLINFNILNTLNQNISNIILFVFLFIILNTLFKLDIFQQTVISFIILPAFISVIVLVCFQELNLWIPPVNFFLACLLSFLTVSIYVIFSTSRFLDRYITELSGKTKGSTSGETDYINVQSKLSNLKGLTDHIYADKTILEMVLTSVSSIIILFDSEGKVLYSNDPQFNKENFNITQISEDININEIKEATSNINFYKTRIEIKLNHYNFFVSITNNQQYVCILNDITDMVNINQMKTNMLRMLSHEFKTPLATILLCSDYMSELNTDRRMDKYLDKISNQTVFLEEMIDSFLTLNKLEVSDFRIEPKPVNINDFIETMISNLKVLAENKGIKIIFNKSGDIPAELSLDPNYFHIALKNLIDNAIKYSPENTEIIVSLEKNNDQVLISVKDQGFWYI